MTAEEESPADETLRYLRAALDSADDDEVRYHVRQALQHHIVSEDGA
ncbi:MAG: hypothetical protein ABEI27_04035 [Halobellus sp.]